MAIEIFALAFLVGMATFFAGVEIAMLGVGALNLVRGDRKKCIICIQIKKKSLLHA